MVGPEATLHAFVRGREPDNGASESKGIMSESMSRLAKSRVLDKFLEGFGARLMTSEGILGCGL
jgi:hypothetical protein